MSNGYSLEKPWIYQVKVKANLTNEWSDLFEGFAISPQPDGETLLTGLVLDQAALHGLLAKIGGLGIPILSLVQLQDQDSKPNDDQSKKEYENGQ